MTKVFPEHKLPLIFKLAQKGVPAKEIAAQIGENVRSVQRHMKANGIAYPVGQGRKKTAA